MLKKILVLLLVLAVGVGLLLFTARDSRFEAQRSEYFAESPAAIWSLLADVNHWQSWWPGVEDSELLEPLAVGSRIRFKLTGLPEGEPVSVEWLAPRQQLGWAGPGVLGSRVATRIELLSKNGGTEVSIHNSIFGPQAVLAKLGNRENFSRYQELVLKVLADKLQERVAPATGGEKD